MKRFLSFSIIMLLIFGMTSCTRAGQESQTSDTESDNMTDSNYTLNVIKQSEKILIDESEKILQIAENTLASKDITSPLNLLVPMDEVKNAEEKETVIKVEYENEKKLFVNSVGQTLPVRQIIFLISDNRRVIIVSYNSGSIVMPIPEDVVEQINTYTNVNT